MSIVLKGLCYFMLQIMLLLSVLFVLRGHNYPGGGFIGALIAATGVGLYSLAFQEHITYIGKLGKCIIGVGILCLLLSILLPILFSKPLLSSVWIDFSFLGDSMKLGSPLLFDLGIYFSSLGSIACLMMALEEVKHD